MLWVAELHIWKEAQLLRKKQYGIAVAPMAIFMQAAAGLVRFSKNPHIKME
jgi:hypothetical protein